MPSLHEVQADFMTALFNQNSEAALTHIASSAMSNQRRLAIYRNNVYQNFTHALQGVYPVIQRLVGESFFTYAAQHYIDRYPSTSGDLNQYGAHFPEFLSQFPPVEALSYLPDVARLEWAAHLVYYAADHPALDLDSLFRIAPTEYGELKFTLHPAIRLLSSSYPIRWIWQVNQKEYEGDQTVDLAAGGDTLMIRRVNSAIVVEKLSEPEWIMLSQFIQGASLNTVVKHVLTAKPNCNFGTLLQHYIAKSVLVNVSL